MSGDRTFDLYTLLPALYRQEDLNRDSALRAFLEVVGEQFEILKENIDGLWDDFFIETCADWVIPYIGELVGNLPLHEVASRRRADVAKTIYYRRRKGTLPMLDELAEDVTGWAAHAVAFFERLGWTQHLAHQRPDCGFTDIRSVERMDRVASPFDDTSHTVDVRRIAQDEGWHNIHNVGFFLWRLGSYRLDKVPARQAGQAWQYSFSPLGNPAPLFTRLRRHRGQAPSAAELGVPGPIRRAFFYRDLATYRAQSPPRADHTGLYGLFEEVSGSSMKPCPAYSLVVYRNGSPVAPAQDAAAQPNAFTAQIVCARLRPWPPAQAPGNAILIDVESGRLALGSDLGATTGVDVSFHYGFSADMGGGPYSRRKSLVKAGKDVQEYRVKEDGTVATGAPPVTHRALVGTAASPGALDDWAAAGRPDAIVTILDSRTYALPATITLSNEGWLAIQAADGERPLLHTEKAGLAVAVAAPVAGVTDRSAALTLSGVVIEGFIKVTGDLARLRLVHSTLVPGHRLDEDGQLASKEASLEIDGGPADARINQHLAVEIDHSITGPLRVPEHSQGLQVLDSIIDGLGGRGVGGLIGQPGPSLTTERSTILGTTHVRSLQASDAIFAGKIDVVRRQEGCVRFSFVPPTSKVPRRYRCQPDLAVEQAIDEALAARPVLTEAEKGEVRTAVEARVVPSFTSTTYGHPAYCQLARSCPQGIRTGGEEAVEMGAFAELEQPQREANLVLRLQEYLPFGLVAGIIYVT